jgi:hypothetical protein
MFTGAPLKSAPTPRQANQPTWASDSFAEQDNSLSYSIVDQINTLRLSTRANGDAAKPPGLAQAERLFGSRLLASLDSRTVSDILRGPANAVGMNKFCPVICACGSWAVLEAFPHPLEPNVVIGTFRVGAKPACCANEAVREAKTTTSAKANFAKVFDMGESFHNSVRTRVFMGSNFSTPLNLN